jgi:hypothetical protein
LFHHKGRPIQPKMLQVIELICCRTCSCLAAIVGLMINQCRMERIPRIFFCRETGVKRRCSRYVRKFLLSTTIHQLLPSSRTKYIDKGQKRKHHHGEFSRFNSRCAVCCESAGRACDQWFHLRACISSSPCERTRSHRLSRHRKGTDRPP